MIFVLDACALIALLRREPCGILVDSLLSDEGNTCMVHAINMCEVYYDLLRYTDEERAGNTINRLIMAGVVVSEDLDTDFWQAAGKIKAEYRRIPLADCYCATLANRLGVELITADQEFTPLKTAGVCNIRFIR